jgi:hypothetical protein
VNATVIIPICAIVVLTFVWGLWPRRMPVPGKRTAGRSSDIKASLSRLMYSSSSVERDYLIIRVGGTEDFIQFTGDAKGVQIDFPLVTARQRSNERKIKEIAAGLSLEFRETRGSDGSRFLDCDYSENVEKVASVCRELLSKIYGVTDDTELIFETPAA